MFDRIFKLKENSTDIKTEIFAGISTFISLAYIVFLIPGMISQGVPNPETIYNGVFIASCLASFVGTLLMALVANWPVAQAPGIGACGFFTFTIMIKHGVSYDKALFLNFLVGLLFILCSTTGIREKLLKSIPNNIKIGISVGIGIFIAFVGLKNGGVLVSNESTIVGLTSFNIAEFSTASIAAALTIFGVILIGVLRHFNIKASVLITITFITLISIPLGVTKGIDMQTITPLSTMFKDFADVSLFANIRGGFQVIEFIKESFSNIMTMLLLTFCLFISNIFDSIGTLIAVAKAAKLTDEKGEIKGLSKSLMCDAAGTAIGTCLGSSTVTSFLESGVGVSEGGKTGLTSLVTSVLFLVAILLGPLCSIVPNCAIAPALIYVGVLIIYSIKDITTDDITELIPTTIAILLIPLSCDIATGIAFSFISYTLIKVLTGNGKKVSPYMYLSSFLFIVYFLMA